MNRRHKACRAPRLQPAMRHPPSPSSSASCRPAGNGARPRPRPPPLSPRLFLRVLRNLLASLSPRCPPLYSLYPPARYTPPATRALSRISSSETLLPTPPRDLWPLEFSSRAPLLRNLNSLRLLPFPSRFSPPARQPSRPDVHRELARTPFPVTG